MPGRQAHGRPLLAAKSAPKASKKSKSKTQARALDAFGIAQEQFPTKEKRTPRFRDIQGEGTKKRHAEEEDDEDHEEGDEDEDEQPRRKKAKPSRPANDDDSDEWGSDSEGNEWRYGVGEDDDSELDSDEAFGDSDNEKFEGYAFGGSKSTKSKKKKQQDSDDDGEDYDDPDDFDAGDDGEDLGDEAIDLATALDMAEEDSEEEGEGEEGSDESGSEEDDDADSESSEDEDDEDADPSKLDALQGFIKEYGGEEEDAPATSSKAKISFKDLGLSAVKDPRMKKAMKLMTKEDKETQSGSGKKLAVPLAKRQEDKLLRSAAYDKTNETLDRWTDTVKSNRRAEHLVFPLPENAQDAGLNHDELQPITAKNTSNELEQTILSIMQQSGLAMTKHEEKNKAEAEAQEGLSKEALKELVNQKRQQRELNSREAKRQARIKKIKSKAYHRVHRKQRERDELKLHEAMVEAGEIDSEEERFAQDRARALERVGARHRESRWAKAGAGNKRAVWDDDYRAGLHDMARKEEELRQRKEGRAPGAASDEDESDDASDEGGNRDLISQLDRLDAMDDDEPQSKLMQMKFMQKAEAAQKKANDDMIAQIRKDLDSDADENDSQDEVTEIGRRKFGGAKSAASTPVISGGKTKKAVKATSDADVPGGWEGPDGAASLNIGNSITAQSTSTGNAWSSGEPRRKGKKSSAPVVDTINTTDIIHAGSKPKPKPSSSAPENPDSDTDLHLPLAIRDVAQLDKAFAGDNVFVDFDAEKAALEEEQDDKVIDNTLPGWGSWVGDGVSAREKARHKGRFVTKVEGTKKKDRKDAKLAKVIINEKRVKNNDKYLATQLPHPFESRAQYERALRLPMGPEWMTKESFQQAVKPRVLMKQGIIAPMSRPSQ